MAGRFRNAASGVVVTAADGLVLGHGWEAVTEDTAPARKADAKRPPRKRAAKRASAPVRSSDDD